MKHECEQPTYTWRYLFILFVLLLGIVGLLARLLYLGVYDSNFLRKQGNARTLRTVSLPAFRGMLTDRNGEPLAISTPVASVWVNPQKFVINEKNIKKLATLIKVDPKRLKKRIKRNKHREFVYVRRQLAPNQAEKVKTLKLPGVHLTREFRRYYPEGEVAAQLVGFTNIDDRGQEGMELAYNKWLRGIPGRKRVLVDRLGRSVADVDTLREAQPGRNLALSIDRRIQYLAYRDLKRAINKYKAKSGSIVVLDVKTGEVLAMANQPSFNPNHRTKGDVAAYRNRAVTDVFEPGSTIKSFSVANALTNGHYTPRTKINTNPGWLMLDGHKVSDEHDNGVIDVTTILQRSSNMGVTKLTLSLPADSLLGTLQQVGFGKRTASGFPGEVSGYLPKNPPRQAFDLATLSFGYGMSVTDLQLAQAYAIVAAGGIKRPVSLLRVDKAVPGRQALSRNVSRELLTMLESVVEPGGTATRAQVRGYRVAGKTGTVRKVGPDGYEKNHHVAIFVGAAPVSNPRLVVAVMVNDPSGGQFYGGLVAAPVFSQVMGGALRLLDIPPDHQLMAQHQEIVKTVSSFIQSSTQLRSAYV